LKNLVSNAIKFTDQGRVGLSALCSNGGVEIQVRDSGIGIAADAQSVIFEPFRQAEGAASRGQRGGGLGLYIVRRLVDLLGGRVEVDSELGRGSTFRVWLPSG